MAIPKTMHAWRKHRGNPEAVYEEIAVPPTPANGFLIKILAAGLCHSDVGVVARDGTAPHYQEKFVIGHEGCGEIIAIGDEVKAEDGWKVGMRVAINPVPGCGKDDCVDCSNDLMQLCEKGPRLGLGHDGSFAEYIAVPARCCVPVPDGIKDAEAAVSTDAIMTSHHAIVRRAQITKKDTVFLFGLGGLGFNALQILLHIGCRFFVSETRQEPLDEAVKLGVPKENVVPVGANVQEWVVQKGLENQIDVVVDIVGVEQTFDDAQVIGKLVQYSSTKASDVKLICDSSSRRAHNQRRPSRSYAQNQQYPMLRQTAGYPAHLWRTLCRHHRGHGVNF
jgi:propanol-preferring alcohol dehydrogenase